jgi:chemotaxis protein methyltransferase CheR
MKDKIPDQELQQVRGLVAETTGLDFPPSRWGDLRRGIAAAAKELGFDASAGLVSRLMEQPSCGNELELLINHLTVGETYFFREKRSFEILADRILPALIRARRNGERRLRIWSAACCTGEEAYSIAIALRRLIPDWENWKITLLATDINSRFLQAAVSGVFGQWSFRDAPSWLRRIYFQPTGDGHFEISPEIRRIVRFARLNLVEDAYPSAETDTQDMDVIFCRNVLMYFTEAQARKVIQRLYRAQADGGWLIVGPGELPNVACVPYAAANCHGAILYQKNGEAPRPEPLAPAAMEFAPVKRIEPRIKPLPQPPIEPRECPPDDSPSSPALNQLAVSSANDGKLPEALEYCNQWIASDRLNPSSHCLRAVILLEQGELAEAIGSLRTALYLNPNCVQAHVAMGNIARARGNSKEAARHLKNAEKLLRRLPSEDSLPEFEGVTAGRLLQFVESLIAPEALA